MMVKRLIYIIILATIFTYSCKDKKGSDFSKEFQAPDSVLYDGDLEVSEQAMGEIVQNISSPVEMAALIKSLGVPFSKDYLATTDYADGYTSSFNKALGLGVFGADLGYLNMYNKTSLVIEYITVIKELADGIRVGQFFDFTTLKRLATNNENLDSLMYISVQNFNQMDRYLRESKRSNLSALIIAGVWIEGMYLLCEVTNDNPTEDLAIKIGDQKTILSNLMLILKNYQKDPKFKDIIEEFQELQDLYDGVTITIIKGEPTAIEVDGALVIDQNEESIINITDEQLNDIIEKVIELRNNIIKL